MSQKSLARPQESMNVLELPNYCASQGLALECHLLNSTLTATERTLCCILENWQTEEGFVVPPALRPWMQGIEFIPFVKKLDKKGKLVEVSPPPPPLFAPKENEPVEAKTAAEMIAALNLGQ